MQARKTTRLAFVDIARTYAIFLALFAHASITVGLFDEMGSSALLIKQFTRMATPMFVFMFGFMVEHVYVRKASTAGLQSINRRILVRSFQCYAAYAITSLAAWAGGYNSFSGFVYSLLFLSDSRFGNILRAYSVMLLLTPLIIRIRLAFGPRILLLGLIVLILSFSLLHHLQSADFGLLNHPLNILLGIGMDRGGPSVYGALSFYLSGMIMASSLTAPRSGASRAWLNMPTAALLLLVTCFSLWFLLIQDSFAEAWRLFADMTYRSKNSPAYFIIGIIGSVTTLFLIYLLVGDRKLPRWTKWILPLGTSSLVSYTAGNVLLNCFGGFASVINTWLFLLAFFLLVVLITTNIKSLPLYEPAHKMMNLRFSDMRRTSEF